MRFVQTLIPTLKEAPSDAKTASHTLLIRAGYIRQSAAGIFSLLPLGWRVVQKIQAILRQELGKSGAAELQLPLVQPAPLWQESGRWQAYGPQLLRIQDRKKFDFVLSPTAEEAVVDLVRSDVKTYRKLPLNLYQIHTKFRDEDRPRAGLLRGREFIMKDGYSFHASEEDALREYNNMYQAYHRIFQRCGLDFRAVEADTGAIGGNLSHEFQVLADSGEDSIVSCSHCNYAANVEKAVLQRSAQSSTTPTISGPSIKTEVPTPGHRTITEVASFLGLPATDMLKTLLYVADGKPIAVLLRGDHQLNEPKLKTLLQASVCELASEALVAQITGAAPGFAGPVGLDIPLYADWEVVPGKAWVTGANKTDVHLKNVHVGVDFHSQYADLRVATAGDPCGKCGQGTYRSYRGIEVGHVFFLGTKYSAPMRCEFLDQDGALKPMQMGCYGIGVTRIMAAAVEQLHDDRGLRWPVSLAPFQAVIVTLGNDPAIQTLAQGLHDRLEQQGVEVLLDDRDERAGVKFADAELIGIPIRLTIGKRSLSDKTVEIRRREEKTDVVCSIEDSVAQLVSMIAEERPRS